MLRVSRLLLGWVVLAGCVEPANAQPAPATGGSPSLRPPTKPAALPAWPAATAPLTVQPLQVPPGFRKKRIYLDAGHGYRANSGNTSVTCETEAENMLRVAEDLARRLEATGRFKVRLSRRAGQQVHYRTRVSEAESWNADAFVSLHSDARGEAVWWEPTPGQKCLRQDATPGYSVLWSDETADPLRTRRVTLAQGLSQRIGEAGFLPYDGVDYVGLYEGDPEHPGVFVDRHEPGLRIMMLRRPRIPSVIIETHHALDFEEAARWKETRTLEAFAAAVAQGLVDGLSREPSPTAPLAATGTAAEK